MVTPTHATEGSYIVPAPFDPAVERVRRALSGIGARVIGEWSTSGEGKSRRVIPTCLVLIAGPAGEGGNVAGRERDPELLHVVIAGHGPHTDVNIIRFTAVEGAGAVPELPGAGQFRERVREAMGRVGTRVGASD